MGRENMEAQIKPGRVFDDTVTPETPAAEAWEVMGREKVTTPRFPHDSSPLSQQRKQDNAQEVLEEMHRYRSDKTPTP